MNDANVMVNVKLICGAIIQKVIVFYS